MGAKDISKTMSLKDGVSSTLQKISGSTVRYKKNLQDLKSQGNDTWKSIKTGVMSLAGITAGYLSLEAASEFMGSAADDARAAAEADTKLAAVLKNVKGVTDDQVNSLKDYAQQLENTGVVGADVITSGLQQVGTFQLQADTLKTLMPGMADLLAQQKGLNATQEDAVGIGNLIGKVMTGQVSALSRVGISFTDAQEKVLKFGSEQEKAATLAEVLQLNVGGVNAAIAETDFGKIQQGSNAFGQLKEAVGGVVLKFKAEFASVFLDKLPQIQQGVQGVTDKITGWIDNGGIQSLIDGLQDVYATTVGIYSFMKDNWSTISPILLGIAAALTAYKLAQMGVATWTAITTVKQWALNVAMDANPIGLIITGIALLIAYGVWLWKNWDNLGTQWKILMMVLGGGIGTIIAVSKGLIDNFENIELAGMKTWNGIVNGLEWMINKVIDGINFMIGKTIDPINAMIEMLNKIPGVSIGAISANAIDHVNWSAGTFNTDGKSFDWVNPLAKKQGDASTGVPTGSDAAASAPPALASMPSVFGKMDNLADALDENTTTMKATAGGGGIHITVNGSDLTAEEIADKLVPRLQHKLFA